MHCSGGEWFDGTSCHNGLDTNITFDFAADQLTLPSRIIYGISYSSQTAGPHPSGNPNDPANSLNIALANDPTDVTVGSSTTPATVFINMASNSSLRCDSSGTEGVGCIRPGLVGLLGQLQSPVLRSGRAVHHRSTAGHRILAERN